MANGNPFYVQPGNNMMPGLQGLSQGLQDFGQQRRQDEAQDRIRQGQQEMAKAAQAGDSQRLAALSAEYPELRESARQAFQITNQQTEQAARDTYMQALSDPQNAAQYMQQGIQRVSELGGSPRMMQSDLEMLQQDPEAAMQRMSMGLASVDPEAYQAVFSGQGEQGPSIGTYNPRDYTTDSFAEFQQSGDPSVLQRYESQKVIDVGGVPHLFNPTDGTITPGEITGSGFQPTGDPKPYEGRGRQTEGREPQETQPQEGGESQPITAQTVGEAEAEIAGARQRAKQEAQSEAPEEQRKRQEQQEKIQENIARSSDITRQAESLSDNPDYIDSITGTLSAVPAIPGTSKYDAQIAFERLKNSLTMGNLDKMSGVLSESDIKILQSAAGGLEMGMSKPAFKERLNRIRSVFEEKTQKEQQKLQEMMGGEEGQGSDDGETVNWSDL